LICSSSGIFGPESFEHERKVELAINKRKKYFVILKL
jgi:hypothetical protein